jgi:hypothetical protein
MPIINGPNGKFRAVHKGKVIGDFPSRASAQAALDRAKGGPDNKPRSGSGSKPRPRTGGSRVRSKVRRKK